MPPAIFAAVLTSAFLHASWNAILSKSGSRSHTVAWIGFATFLVSAPFAFRLGFPTPAAKFMFASASLHVVYLYLLAKAYEKSDLSFAYPIARGSSPALVALGGLLFASERLGLFQVLGIGLVTAGILLIGLEKRSWKVGGLVLALFIGGIIGVYTVIDALGARASESSAQFNAWEFSLYGLAVSAINFGKEGRKAFEGSWGTVGMGFAGGVASVIAYSIVVWAMVHGPMGPVSAIRETSSLFAVAIGILCLHEPLSIQKSAGACTIVVGVFLIGFGK